MQTAIPCHPCALPLSAANNALFASFFIVIAMISPVLQLGASVVSNAVTGGSYDILHYLVVTCGAAVNTVAEVTVAP